MDWVKWMVDLATAGACGFLGASLASYVKGYSEQKGKHLATYEDLESLLMQERSTAYEREKGKQVATHEDFDRLLREIRLMTAETEKIKGSMAAIFAETQRRLIQKQDIYFALLENLEDTADVWNRKDQLLDGTGNWWDKEQEVNSINQKLVELRNDFRNLHSKAIVYLASESLLRSLDEYYRDDQELISPNLGFRQKKIGTIIPVLTQAAREDLQSETPTVQPANAPESPMSSDRDAQYERNPL